MLNGWNLDTSNPIPLISSLLIRLRRSRRSSLEVSCVANCAILFFSILYVFQKKRSLRPRLPKLSFLYVIEKYDYDITMTKTSDHRQNSKLNDKWNTLTYYHYRLSDKRRDIPRINSPKKAGLSPRRTKFKMQFRLTRLIKDRLLFSVAKVITKYEIYVRIPTLFSLFAYKRTKKIESTFIFIH